MQTVLLSSNRLSCEAVSLDGAAGLGKGNWTPPTQLALLAAGEGIEREMLANQYADIVLTNQSNTALSFAGNLQVRYISATTAILYSQCWFLRRWCEVLPMCRWWGRAICWNRMRSSKADAASFLVKHMRKLIKGSE